MGGAGGEHEAAVDHRPAPRVGDRVRVVVDLLGRDDADDAVVQAAESAVREVVGKMTMDNAMADERDQIAPRVRQLMQTILDRYKVGVEVVGINLQQGGVRP